MYPFMFKNNEVAALAYHLMQSQCPLPFSMIMANLVQYDLLTTESDATTRNRLLEVEDEPLEEMRKTFEVFATGKKLLSEHGVDLPDEALATKVFEGAQRKLQIVEAEQASRKLKDTGWTPTGRTFYDVASGKDILLITEEPYVGWVCVKGEDGKWKKDHEASSEELRRFDRKKEE